MKDFEYFAPHSLQETVALKGQYKKSARMLAGGTDLIVQMKAGTIRPEVIIDAKNIPELNRLELDSENTLHIGGAVPLAVIVASSAVKEKFAMLHQACALIGSDQLRNRASLGGNICNAAPSADSAPPLLCLGAKAITAGSTGTQTIALQDFFLGPGKTALKPGQILIEIQVPAMPEGSVGCYERLTTREEMDIAMVGVAALITLSTNHTCRDVKIALGAVSPAPIMVPEAEAAMKGKQITMKTIEQMARVASDSCVPISDIRASAEYRREMVKVLARRTLTACCRSLGINLD